MARQPLMMTREIRRIPADQLKFRVLYDFGHASWNARPEHVSKIAQCMMLWTRAEVNLAALLAALLRSDADASIAVYSTLRRASPRQEALRVASEHMLNDESHLLVRALLRHIQSVEGQRNDLAHGMWGTTPEIEDGLIWISQQEMSLVFVELLKNPYSRGPTNNDAATKKIMQNTFVYRLADLEEIESSITTLIRIINEFRGCIAFAKGEPPLAIGNEAMNKLKQFKPIMASLEHLIQRESKRTP
jgi:hypothetical protein